jgi:hypothetical protein
LEGRFFVGGICVHGKCPFVLRGQGSEVRDLGI